MAIDLNKLRAKYEQMNSNGGGANLDKYFKLEKGNNIARILPGPDEDTEWFSESKIHRIKQPDGKIKNFHCRRVHGEDCPLCDLYFGYWELANEAEARGDEAEMKKFQAMARALRANDRYYMNAYDYETESVKILSVGKKIFNKIVGTMMDEDFGDITDVDTGHDFKIVKVQEANDQWPNYDQSQARPKATKLADSKQRINEIMESLHNLQELVPLETYEEAKEIVNNLTGVTVASEEKSTPTSNASTEAASDDDYAEKLKG